MNKATGLFIFAMGAIIGSVVTWQYTKRLYEQRAQEEIDSVAETISSVSEEETARVNIFEEKPDISQYVKMVKEANYISTDESSTAKNGPYVISPDEFGELDEYEQISLTYYADQVLADDNEKMIKDVDYVVGVESLTHFGEYEDDSVFVRNDRLKCDFEILMDTRTYSEILKKRPHQREI